MVQPSVFAVHIKDFISAMVIC